MHNIFKNCRNWLFFLYCFFSSLQLLCLLRLSFTCVYMCSFVLPGVRWWWLRRWTTRSPGDPLTLISIIRNVLLAIQTEHYLLDAFLRPHSETGIWLTKWSGMSVSCCCWRSDTIASFESISGTLRCMLLYWVFTFLSMCSVRGS